MEKIVFPIPEICGFLTEETKLHVYNTAERDEQGSKVADFFERVDDMYSEMIWQRDLRGNGRTVVLMTNYKTLHCCI